MPQSGSTWVGEIERREKIRDLTVDRRFGAARLLVRADGAPVGLATVRLTDGWARAAELRAAIDEQVGPDHAPVIPPSSTEPVTVVIATRGRPESLDRCIRQVLACDHPAVTVLVVDNDPVDDHTAAVVNAFDNPNVVYIREPRRGASVGRNRGLREARTEIVAFTDDDTEVDSSWLHKLAGAFATDSELVCLSGPVLAARLATDEELAAEHALSWTKGFEPRRFSLADPPPESSIFPFSPGLFGVGANLAVRADVARDLGGFDEALGPGSASHGGEDCEFMVRLVLAGHVVGYEPSVLVWHHHRTSGEALHVQLRGYAVGLGAFLAKVALDRGARAAAMRRVPAAVVQLHRISARGSAAGDVMPESSDRRRWTGLLVGPWAYLRARRAARRAGGQVPPLTRRRRNYDSSATDPDVIYITEIDVRHDPGQMSADVVGSHYQRAQVLVRDGRRTVDVVRVPVRDGVLDMTGLDASAQGSTPDDSRYPASPLRAVSIVIPTVARPAALVRCVKSLLGTGYPDLEVIVVDNRPDPGAIDRWQALVASDARIHYLAEPRPGASAARNAGVATARGDYIGFVDDDIEVDRWWLHNLAAELANPEVDCVTSLVLPAHLETRAQRVFEQMKGFGQGARRRQFGPDLWERDPSKALAPGRFGPGGCALWRRSTLERLGGFDQRLGPGTPSQAGEDLYLFLCLVREGGCVVYQPDAVAWHEHAADWSELRTRIRGYGAGMAALQLLNVLRHPRDVIPLARVLPARLRQVVLVPSTSTEQAHTVGGDRPPRSLVFDQLLGMASGPISLARGARAHRREQAVARARDR